TLHSKLNDDRATALAFDLMMLGGEDLRRKPYLERKTALRKLLRGGRGVQYVEHAEGHGDKLFEAACKLGLEGTVSKKLTSVYHSGPSIRAQSMERCDQVLSRLWQRSSGTMREVLIRRGDQYRYDAPNSWRADAHENIRTHCHGRCACTRGDAGQRRV